MVEQRRYEAQKAQLNADQLIAQAMETAGYNDFGPFEFETALRKLLDCFAKDMPLSEQGMSTLQSDIVRMLVNRLLMQEDIKRHPEILEEDVSDPFIIIGLPRSGTTKLHKMLSSPDNVQKTLFWRLQNPAPFTRDFSPGHNSIEADPRIAAMAESGLLTEDNPDMNAAHRIAVEEVEEEGLVYQMCFKDYTWSQLLDSPEYFDWIMSQSSSEVYQFSKRVFQYLQWQDGGKRGRPWVFKSVPHLAYVDTLLETFPNATLIQPHRSPHKCIPSFAKFTGGLVDIYADSMNKRAHGAETLRTWTTAMERYLQVREKLALDERILDADYEMVRSDPMAIVRQAYERSPFTLSEESDRIMLAWHEQNSQGKHGVHEYSLQEFGLTELDIEKHFGDYIERFIAS